MATVKSNFVFNLQEKQGLAKLFKLMPISAFTRENRMASAYQCMRRGYVFVTEGGNLVNPVPQTVISVVDALYGTDALKLNQTFHKSYGTVARMDPDEYYTQQIIHYFSTYGREFFGLTAQPWIPVERLNLPMFEFKANRLTIIRVAEFPTIIEAINKFAANTVSPSVAIIEAFKPLMHRITIPTDDIKSFELQVIKHDMDGTVPTNPTSVLRYLVYKTTEQTLLIKNQRLVRQIQANVQYGKYAAVAYEILSRADQAGLASIFLRYKPIFLAYKKYPRCAPIINRLRRLADEYHRPLPDVTLQNFTKLAFEGRDEDCAAVIEKASNRDLVKLANHLGARLAAGGDNMPGVFNIRNGRTFVKDDAFEDGRRKQSIIYEWLVIITDNLACRLAPVLKDKVFVLPEYIDYAAPTTEKQFVGNIPWGTRILGAPNGAYTTGVHWFNQKNTRVDIDLHLNSATEHLGWNGGYRNGQRIIYTGDLTSAPAPHGAAEAFWFDPNCGTYVLSANLFSGPADTEFRMFMTALKPDERCQYDKNYTFDENKSLFAPIPLKFHGDERQVNLGLFADGGFYFYGGAITSGIVPNGNYESFIKGLTAKVKNQWLISELLGQAGAIVVDSLNTDELTDEQKEKAIDLSPGALTATTLLDIVDGNVE